MPKCKLVVTSPGIDDKWKDTEFGPFDSVPHARKKLEEKGWFYQPRGVWTAQISRYNGLEACLKTIKGIPRKLAPLTDIPQGFAGFMGD